MEVVGGWQGFGTFLVKDIVQENQFWISFDFQGENTRFHVEGSRTASGWA